MIITSKVMQSIFDGIKFGPFTNENVRKVLFDNVSMNDIVPEQFVDKFVSVMSLYYDKSGKGYRGVMNEITKRIDTIRFTEKIINMGGVPVHEFFLKKQGQTDTIDFDNHTGYEEKAGAGNWLYNDKSSSFEETIAMYRRKRTKIRWDYPVTVNTKKYGKETFHIEIITTYSILFDFLADYPKGFKTWWKENSKSGETGCYVWEMQTITSSRKKAEYLTTFDQWLKDHNK